MARRRNYGFERRQKDVIRRTRQEAKRERKAERGAEGNVGPEMGEAPDTSPPPGQWEWFSPSRGRVVATAEGQHPEGEAPDDWVLLTETGEQSEAGEGSGAGPTA